MNLKKLLITSIIIFIMLVPVFYAQEQPQISFADLVLNAETNYSLVVEARKAALNSGFPWSVYLPEQIFAEALGVEENKPVYSVIKNSAHPFDGGETAFFEQIENNYDLTNARINYGNGQIVNPLLGYNFSNSSSTNRAVEFLLVPESSNDRVMTFDATTGDLIDAEYIPSQDTLSTPIQARLSPWGTITVSDQLEDLVFAYDTTGVLLSLFAPAGGVNNAILDNVRGHNYTPGGNLVVTVASGANSDAVAEFDNTGAYLGNFIEPNAAIMDGPFDIIFRTSDVLVTASTTDAVHRYDLTGTYIDNLVSNINFPEQINEFANGDLVVAGFSTPSGLYVYDSVGAQIAYFSNVTGLRGGWRLGNGNYLVTNGSGVHEIDGTTGALLRTVVAGVSARFISPYDPDIIPVELTSFTARIISGTVTLNWTTATETNNSGFAVERCADNTAFAQIGFVQGNGTTTEISSYTYNDESVQPGTYYYRLKQIDFDGTFEYSNTIEIDFSVPTAFSLQQNYPNPFNPSTTISFALPVNSKVTIALYNSLGQEVRVLVTKNYAAGNHQLDFNASELSSGAYLYTIKATGVDGSIYNSTMKMMLMK